MTATTDMHARPPTQALLADKPEVFQANLEDAPEQDHYTVHGVVLGDNDYTRGKYGLKKWVPEELEAAADSLEGREFALYHEDEAIAVGIVTRAGYQPGVGVLYEAEIDEYGVAKKLLLGQFEVSVEAQDPVAVDYEDNTGAAIMRGYTFTRLSAVEKGASPSNHTMSGPASSNPAVAALTADAVDQALGAIENGDPDSLSDLDIDLDDAATGALAEVSDLPPGTVVSWETSGDRRAYGVVESTISDGELTTEIEADATVSAPAALIRVYRPVDGDGGGADSTTPWYPATNDDDDPLFVGHKPDTLTVEDELPDGSDPGETSQAETDASDASDDPSESGGDADDAPNGPGAQAKAPMGVDKPTNGPERRADDPAQPGNVNTPTSIIDAVLAMSDVETTPPKTARKNAQKVLRWRDEHSDEIEGMTDVGWRRARQLADGDQLSPDVVGRMAQFARHAQNSGVADENVGKPWMDAGHVAWLGWGGDVGVNWAQRKVQQLNNAAESSFEGVHTPQFGAAASEHDDALPAPQIAVDRDGIQVVDDEGEPLTGDGEADAAASDEAAAADTEGESDASDASDDQTPAAEGGAEAAAESDPHTDPETAALAVSIHDPTWSGTTTTASSDGWSRPALGDFDTDDLGEVAGAFLASETGFPPENYTDLILPVVTPDGELSLPGLRASASRLPQAESVTEDERATLKTKIANLANDNFDAADFDTELAALVADALFDGEPIDAGEYAETDGAHSDTIAEALGIPHAEVTSWPAERLQYYSERLDLSDPGIGAANDADENSAGSETAAASAAADDATDGTAAAATPEAAAGSSTGNDASPARDDAGSGGAEAADDSGSIAEDEAERTMTDEQHSGFHTLALGAAETDEDADETPDGKTIVENVAGLSGVSAYLSDAAGGDDLLVVIDPPNVEDDLDASLTEALADTPYETALGEGFTWRDDAVPASLAYSSPALAASAARDAAALEATEGEGDVGSTPETPESETGAGDDADADAGESTGADGDSNASSDESEADGGSAAEQAAAEKGDGDGDDGTGDGEAEAEAEGDGDGEDGTGPAEANEESSAGDSSPETDETETTMGDDNTDTSDEEQNAQSDEQQSQENGNGDNGDTRENAGGGGESVDSNAGTSDAEAKQREKNDGDNDDDETAAGEAGGSPNAHEGTMAIDLDGKVVIDADRHSTLEEAESRVDELESENTTLRSELDDAKKEIGVVRDVYVGALTEHGPHDFDFYEGIPLRKLRTALGSTLGFDADAADGAGLEADDDGENGDEGENATEEDGENAAAEDDGVEDASAALRRSLDARQPSDGSDEGQRQQVAQQQPAQGAQGGQAALGGGPGQRAGQWSQTQQQPAQGAQGGAGQQQQSPAMPETGDTAPQQDGTQAALAEANRISGNVLAAGDIREMREADRSPAEQILTKYDVDATQHDSEAALRAALTDARSN